MDLKHAWNIVPIIQTEMFIHPLFGGNEPGFLGWTHAMAKPKALEIKHDAGMPDSSHGGMLLT